MGKKTFKNTKFVERDYEATNIVYCKADVAPYENWVEVSEDIPASMMQLFIQGGVRYYGWL